jgi:hypothetical protein
MQNPGKGRMMERAGLLKAENLSYGRLMIFSREIVNDFFKTFEANHGRYEIAPTASFNILVHCGRDRI